MKKKYITIGIGILAFSMLTGCANTEFVIQSLGAEQEKPAQIVAEPVAEEEISRLQELLREYGTSAFSEEEYLELAACYLEESRNREARNLMEEYCRLYADTEGFEMLKEIVVNLAEEDEKIVEQIALLEQNLGAADLFAEGISMLYHNDWTDTLMPKMKSGKRNYYQEKENGSLYIEIGYDSLGAKCTNVWQITGEEVLVIVQTPKTLQVMKTGLADNEYHGAFESWRLMADSGDIYHETGTFEKGLYAGVYTADVRKGNDESDIMSLWNSRENFDMRTYQGEFDTDGKTTLEQPEGLNGADGETEVIYAYASDK